MPRTSMGTFVSIEQLCEYPIEYWEYIGTYSIKGFPRYERDRMRQKYLEFEEEYRNGVSPTLFSEEIDWGGLNCISCDLFD